MNSDGLPILDLLHPDYINHPYPMIERALAEAPIFYDARFGGWMLSRYRDVMTLQRDPRLSCQRHDYVSAPLPRELKAQIRPLVDWYAQWIVMMDAPHHTRLRRLASHAFQPRQLSRLERRAREVVSELLDGLVGRGEMDALSDFAYPIPQTIICEMVGIPREDRSKFIEWTNDISALVSASLTTGEEIERVLRSYEAMKSYFNGLIAERRKKLVEDEILSGLIVASEQDDTLTAEEVINLLAFIMVGGYESTAHLITNGILLLLKHPEQLALLQRDRSLIPSAVEEMLRFEPSTAFNVRKVTEPIEYKGHRFEAGTLIYMLSIAANRDPEQFPDPGRFDVTRKDNKHVTFGFGPHYCLGANLARMEALVAFEGLLERVPGMRLAEQRIERQPNIVVRPLKRLLVRW